MMYVKPTKIRALARRLGKRCPRSFIAWLDARVESIVTAEAASIGGRKTLSAEDAELRRQLGRRG